MGRDAGRVVNAVDRLGGILPVVEAVFDPGLIKGRVQPLERRALDALTSEAG